MSEATYLLALGSNVRGRHGSPAATLRAAIAAFGEDVVAASPIIASAPVGPSIRRYANAVVLVASELSPPAMLARAKATERAFGRRRGRRWGARVLDVDLVLWSGGRWRSAGLEVPHRAFRERGFVLGPAASIAGEWRDPVTGLSVRQLLARLTRRRPVSRSRRTDGLSQMVGVRSSVGRASDF